MKTSTLLPTLFVLVISVTGLQAATLPFLDDFQDGNPMDNSPATWVPRELQPGSYTVEDVDDPPDGQREYRLSPHMEGGTIPWMVADLRDLDTRNVSITAQVRRMQTSSDSSGWIGISARISPNDPSLPADDYTGYWAAVRGDKGLSVGSTKDDTLAKVRFDVDVTQEDVVMQFDLFGPLLSLRAWRAGDSKPVEPQIAIYDPTYESGTIELWASPGPEPDEDTMGIFRWVEVTPIARAPIWPLRPNYISTVIDNDHDATFDNTGDTASNRIRKPRGAVGETDLENTNEVTRLVAKFELPEIEQPTRLLESATLRFFLESVEGTPMGPVSLFHGIEDNGRFIWGPDYEDPKYTDTQIELVQPTDPGGTYYETDVTDLVLADYAADGNAPLSAFRLQVSGFIFDEDNQSSRYQFTMPGADANHPQLVLTFVPEPSTIVLAVMLGLAGLLRVRY